MLQIPRRAVGLVLANSHRCFSALTSTLYSACSANKVKEAPILDNDVFLALPEEARERNNLETTIFVPELVDLTPVNGLPEDSMRPRRARIYQPQKNAMQSGTMNMQHWEVEFDNKLRWQNANMGWSSTGDPLSFLKVRFSGMCEAVEFCTKNGWNYYVDVPRPERDYRVDLTPVNGFPAEYIRTRRVRIFQPAKNAMQSGTMNIRHWEIEFDNKQRWENPLMGWTANADPMTCLRLTFTAMCEAVEYCEKNGWMYFIDVPRLERGFRVQNTNFNFSWNKRTRVSTK